VRDAGAERERADVHVAVVDVPAFLAGVMVAAAGEGGHTPLKRDRTELANRSMAWALDLLPVLPVASVENTATQNQFASTVKWRWHR
jgi:hypothetical protein